MKFSFYKHTPAHEIPKDVESVKVGHLTASVDVSSCHRLAQLVWIGKDWQDIVCKHINKDQTSFIIQCHCYIIVTNRKYTVPCKKPELVKLNDNEVPLFKISFELTTVFLFYSKEAFTENKQCAVTI